MLSYELSLLRVVLYLRVIDCQVPLGEAFMQMLNYDQVVGVLLVYFYHGFCKGAYEFSQQNFTFTS